MSIVTLICLLYVHSFTFLIILLPYLMQHGYFASLQLRNSIFPAPDLLLHWSLFWHIQDLCIWYWWLLHIRRFIFPRVSTRMSPINATISCIVSPCSKVKMSLSCSKIEMSLSCQRPRRPLTVNRATRLARLRLSAHVVGEYKNAFVLLRTFPSIKWAYTYTPSLNSPAKNHLPTYRNVSRNAKQ